MNTGSRLLVIALILAGPCVAAGQSAPGAMPGAADIPDRTIYARAGHAIGQVAGVVLDAKERITHAVIVHDVNTGAQLRLTVVPWDVLLASREGERIVLDEHRLGGSPVVTRDELAAASTGAWRDRANRYWRARLRPV